MGWDIERFTDKDSVGDDLICTICTDVVNDPMQTPCDHLFCKECINKWLNGGQRTCPVDREQLSLDKLKRPSRMIMQLYNKLTIRCQNFEKGCKLMCKFEDVQHLIQHENEGCQVAQNIRVSKIQEENEELKRNISRLEKMMSEKDKENQVLKNKVLESQQTQAAKLRGRLEALKLLKRQGEDMIKTIEQHIDEEGVVSEFWNLESLQGGASGKCKFSNLTIE